MKLWRDATLGIAIDEVACPKLADGTRMDLNGRPMNVTSLGGEAPATLKGGTLGEMCADPEFELRIGPADRPSFGDLDLRIADASRTVRLVAKDFFAPVALVRSDLGDLRRGESATLQVVPASHTVQEQGLLFGLDYVDPRAVEEAYSSGVGPTWRAEGATIRVTFPDALPRGEARTSVSAFLVPSMQCEGVEACQLVRQLRVEGRVRLVD